MKAKNKTKTQVGVSQDRATDLTFTVVFREDHDEGGFVAECLELPGCVSEGENREAAEANIKKAIRDCLTVMFEDRVREIARRRLSSASYVGISSQQQVKVKANDWELQTV